MGSARKRRPKRWSYSVGERGVNRVRAFEHPETGRLFAEFYEPTVSGARPRTTRIALGHRVRERAKGQVEEIAARIRSATPLATGHLTLAKLFDNYLREATLGKGDLHQRHERRAARMFLRAFGGETDVRTLSRREWDRYIRDRRSGVLSQSSERQGKRVSDRTIEYDLQFLRAALNWATMVSTGHGGTLLDRNPLSGLPLPREQNPHRPVLSDAEYEKLLSVSAKVDARFTLVLVPSRETGHRIGAIRRLRWSDVDLKQRRVTWRAVHDKIGYEHTTPLSGGAVAALQARLRDFPTIGDAWVFPSPADAARPCTTWLFRDWWERGVALAKLKPVERRGFHSIRRAFATDLKGIPLKDLCQLGGWKDPSTILKCYQHPDEETMRAALKSRERPSVAVNPR